MLIRLMLGSYEHGKVRENKGDIWTTIIAVIIQIWLLSAGGFFDIFWKE